MFEAFSQRRLGLDQSKQRSQPPFNTGSDGNSPPGHCQRNTIRCVPVSARSLAENQSFSIRDGSTFQRGRRDREPAVVGRNLSASTVYPLRCDSNLSCTENPFVQVSPGNGRGTLPRHKTRRFPPSGGLLTFLIRVVRQDCYSARRTFDDKSRRLKKWLSLTERGHASAQVF